MCLVCLLDPIVAARLGRPESTAIEWMLGLMALSTFVTAAHRTVWIAARLRRQQRTS